MKQIHRAKRHRGPASGRQEPLTADPRDPDIVHAHRIARRSSRPGAGRQRRNPGRAAESSAKAGTCGNGSSEVRVLLSTTGSRGDATKDRAGSGQ